MHRLERLEIAPVEVLGDVYGDNGNGGGGGGLGVEKVFYAMPACLVSYRSRI